MSSLILSDHMANVISEYITRFMKPYTGISIAYQVKEAAEAGYLFVRKDGVLGMTPSESGVWHVLFFVAETTETRKSLLREAFASIGHIPTVSYSRWKHNARKRTYSPELLRRLA